MPDKQTALTTRQVLDLILGCSARAAQDLQTEVARLDPFQVITRSGVKTEDFTKFTAEAFFKAY